MISTILLEQTKTNSFALLKSKGGQIHGGLRFADDIDFIIGSKEMLTYLTSRN